MLPLFSDSLLSIHPRARTGPGRRLQRTAVVRFAPARIPGALIRAITIAMLVAAAGTAGHAEPAQLSEVVSESRTLHASRAPDPAALAAYADRARQLRRLALATGSINYAQVIASAYPAGVITADLLDAKAAWRASLPSRGGFIVLADYQLAQSAATVEVLNATPDPTLRSTLVAQYEAVHHWIGLAPAASDFCVYHEAGHALQQAALQARGRGEGPWAASHSTADLSGTMQESARADTTSVARLRYLASQDEFEVRLQDLNRFHALCVAGHPILSPSDSLRALLALGVPVNFEDARSALAAGDESLSQADYLALATTMPVVAAEDRLMFEDALELRLLRRLALRADTEHWPRMLAKILFEAPGHL